jgi:hypothetical protein
MLSYCYVGHGYATNKLTINQKKIVQLLSYFGIIYIPQKQSVIASDLFFYPTSIAINMIFQTSNTYNNNQKNKIKQATDDDADILVDKQNKTTTSTTNTNLSSYNSNISNNLRIIVQTNFQVVAYISNELHFAMLSLFVDISIRFPNMAIGRITRNKAKEAYKVGITVQQIIDFMTIHAHQETKKKNSFFVVPENVQDQLVLWEMENHRIKEDDAVVIDFKDIQGVTRENFKFLIKNLKHVNVILWSDDQQMVIAISTKSFQYVQAYIKENL